MSKSPLGELHELLVQYFSPSELRMFLESWSDGRRLVPHLPGRGVSASRYAFEAARALERFGLIDQALFERIARERPRRKADVWRVAAAWGVRPSAPPRARAAPAPANAAQAAGPAAARPADRYDFFIAYASDDLQHAQDLHRHLPATATVFFDRVSIIPGDDWRQTVDTALHNSLVIAVLVSENVDRAYWQRAEILTSIELSRVQDVPRVVPVFLDGWPEAGSTKVPIGLRSLHGIDGKLGMTTVAQQLHRVLDHVRGP